MKVGDKIKTFKEELIIKHIGYNIVSLQDESGFIIDIPKRWIR